ncbi:hypothetical protein [uncultured Paludibaculum sp.]|uniref:AAA family ATPase n=1 Tax=uncultured Paludibaculum sp. TaxID=1765020 RepID=UPI002AAB6B3E|nr:hypothetical protein [uncultured Paludibaculum sp.]
MPSLIFLEAEDCGWCILATAEIRRVERATPIIAFSRHIDTPGVLELMRAGVREWVQAPVDEGSLGATLERIRTELHELGDNGTQPSELVSFLPCKPGSGSSTVAAHVASLCAKTSGCPVALFDLDLTCGTQQFITEAEGGTSLLEAAQHAHRIDESLWSRFIAKRGKIHLMHSGFPSLDGPLDPHQLLRLLSYAVSQYPVVIADLSGHHETFAIHSLEQSTQIYMVCSPDLASLYLARRQLHFLKELGVADRLELIVNRATFHFGLGQTAIEEILERKPVAYFPNAYIPLQKALKERSLINEDTPFARAVSGLIPRVMKLKTPPPEKRPAANDWMARTKLTHTLQALKAAIHSFRPSDAALSAPANRVLATQAGRDNTSEQPSKQTAVTPACEPVPASQGLAIAAASESTDVPAGPLSPPARRRQSQKTRAPRKARQSTQ